MKNSTTVLETLFEKTTVYVKTSIELYKLEAVSCLANIISSIAVRLIVFFVFVLFSFFLNIGMALFLGEWLGKVYYGFFAMALIYIFLAILFLLFQNQLIKNPICNFIIRKTTENNEND
ncbi:hypothetical protein [Flavobacterium sp.]|uniref:hypothetical protein n=1 Tax=Flavobacterium sp. TaxID=239 RepID=UPI00286E623F|nr:hypothetical protein [Flavobacterium sp.]